MLFRNNYIVFLSIFLLTSFSLSCKKNKTETTISGVVSSEVEGILLNDVEVKFFIKSLSGNSFTNSFELQETKITASDGRYDFGFIKTSSDVDYKIELSKLNYSSKSIFLNPQSINSGGENKKNINLVPFGVINFNIKSNSNTSSSDELHFTFNNEMDEGESYSNIIFAGPGVDTILSSIVIAEKYNSFNYLLKRNGQFLQVTDSIFISKGNTETKEVLY